MTDGPKIITEVYEDTGIKNENSFKCHEKKKKKNLFYVTLNYIKFPQL